MTNIKFAIVGTGAMAAAMTPAFAKVGVDVQAVVSHDPKRATKFAHAFGIPVAETDLVSVLRHGDIDAVYVANAPQEHAATCIAALEAGKAVLCEKPMAMSEPEVERIANKAHQKQALCMEGLWTLFLPAYRRFIELAISGTCGKANFLTANFGYPMSAEPQLHVSEPVGVLLDRGIYLIALAQCVLGSVERVEAEFNRRASGEDEDVYLQLHHKSGGFSQLAASFASLMSNTATLGCSRGLIRLEAPLIGSEGISVLRAPAAQPLRDGLQPVSLREKVTRLLRKSPQLRRINQSSKKPKFEHIGFDSSPYLNQLRHFVDLLNKGSKQSSIVPLDFSLDTARVMDRAVVSAQNATLRSVES